MWHVVHGDAVVGRVSDVVRRVSDVECGRHASGPLPTSDRRRLTVVSRRFLS